MSGGRIIAIHGLLRAGKGTIAGVLEREYGFENTKFAAPFKDMLRAYLLFAGLEPLTVERCIEGDLKNYRLVALGNRSARYVMQVLGSGWRARFAPGIWCDIVDRKLRAAAAEGRRICIDDFRFPVPEADMLTRNHPDAMLWKVFRPEHQRLSHESSGLTEEDVRAVDLDHPAEVTPEVVEIMMMALRPHLGVEGWDTPVDVAAGLSMNQMAAMLRNWDDVCPPQPEDVSTRTHVSEQGMEDGLFGTVFQNTGTVEDLQREVRRTLSLANVAPVVEPLGAHDSTLCARYRMTQGEESPDNVPRAVA